MFHGEHFHQELKANGEGSFDGGVQRKAGAAAWERWVGSQGRTSHTTQSKLRESFGAELRLGETLGLLGGCVEGDRTLCVFLANTEICTKDRLSSTINYLSTPALLS